MDEKIEQAIEVLAGKIVQAVQPDQAIKFTQAILNLAQVQSILAALAAEAGKQKRGPK